jgi:hypothetical protein
MEIAMQSLDKTDKEAMAFVRSLMSHLGNQ